MEAKNPFQLEALISDPSFADYVRKSNILHEEKWKKWIDDNPHNASVVSEAVKILSQPKTSKGITIL